MCKHKSTACITLLCTEGQFKGVFMGFLLGPYNYDACNVTLINAHKLTQSTVILYYTYVLQHLYFF